MRASILYTLQRAVLFVAPFALLMIAQVPWYLSLLISLVFAFCASYIFLRRSRDAAIAELQQARARRQGSDEDAEDAAHEEEDELTDEPAPADEPESEEPTPSDDPEPSDDPSPTDEPEQSDEPAPTDGDASR